MLNKRRMTTAAATLLIAAGTGHMMQYGNALADRMGIGEKISKQDQTKPIATFAEVALHMPNDMAVPMLRKPQADVPVRLAALDFAAALPNLSGGTTPAPFQTSCEADILANAAPGALIELDMAAPCFANSPVIVSHSGLVFSDDFDADGNLTVKIPALAQEATVTVEFRNGEKRDITVSVPELSLYDRVALIWQAPGALHIHAHEFGARQGTAGHVWAEAPASADAGALGKGGFMTLLGNAAVPAARMAEVYSFPAGLVAHDGTVGISVEAVIEQGTCGNDIAGHAIELQNGEMIRDVALQLHIPECDGEFGFLMLNNLLQDMKIARN